MAISKITRNYQLTIPKEIREMVNVKVGDILSLSTEGSEIRASKNLTNAIEKSFGIWRDIKGDSVSYVKKIRYDSEKRRKRLGL